jgi:hypothetical protein
MLTICKLKQFDGLIYAAVLTPTTVDYLCSAQLNPGLSVSVPFSSSNLGVGTIAPSPSVLFNGGRCV